MGARIRVDPTALTDAAATVTTLAGASEIALRALLDALAAEGPCWGRDDTGAAFAASYEAAVDRVHSAWHALSRGVTEIGEAITSSAASVEAGEERARLRFVGEVAR